MTPRDDSIDDDAFKAAVQGSPVSILITDPRRDDHPITFVNEAFERLSLYGAAFALGRNTRFLLGPETDPEDAQRILDGLTSGTSFEVAVTKHRADGAPIRVRLAVAPVHGADGTLTAHVWYLQPLDAPPTPAPKPKVPGADAQVLLRELQHRVKNHLAMIASMVRIQARGEVTPETLQAVSRRIEALGLLYEDLLATKADAGSGRMEAGAYLGRVASVVSSFQSDAAVRVNIDCEEIWLGVDQAAWLGLLLSEFLTNALVHAFRGHDSGRIDVRFARREDGGVRLSVSDDGVGLPATDAARAGATEHHRSSGVGGSIVAALVASLGGGLDVTSSSEGTTVTVEIDPAQ